jgi:hypothetical protein
LGVGYIEEDLIWIISGKTEQNPSSEDGAKGELSPLVTRKALICLSIFRRS